MGDQERLQVVRAGGLAVRVAQPKGAAVAVGVRHAVDFGREGSETEFVGLDLAGQAHTHIGAAVKGVFEADDPLAFGGVAGNLDGVFHRLSAAVAEHGSLVKSSRHQPAEAFGQFDGRCIGQHHETGMGEFGGLVLDRRDDLGMGVADIHHSDAAGEIDIRAPFNVVEHRSPGMVHISGRAAGESFGHHLLPGPAQRFRSGC